MLQLTSPACRDFSQTWAAEKSFFREKGQGDRRLLAQQQGTLTPRKAPSCSAYFNPAQPDSTRPVASMATETEPSEWFPWNPLRFQMPVGIGF
eukprot:s6776_g1.t1